MNTLNRTHRQDRDRGRRLFAALGAFLVLWAAPPAVSAAEPIKALLIAGGCCHDYPNQNKIIPDGVSARANVRFTTVLQGGTDRSVKSPCTTTMTGPKATT